MSTREDLEADARHEMETDAQYDAHELHIVRIPDDCWLCRQEIEEEEVEAASKLYRGAHVGSSDSDPVYRTQMRDAGRGELLR